MRTAVFALLTISAILITGCDGDPVKPAGPGGMRMQPYDASTGTYK